MLTGRYPWAVRFPVPPLKVLVPSQNGQSLTGLAQFTPPTIFLFVDFLFIGPAGTKICSEGLATFVKLCGELGVPLAHEKTKGPAMRLTFLGVELDSVLQQSCLPLAKLVKLR